jgi:hypothetical protein
MKIIYITFLIISILVIISCRRRSDIEVFEDILNDPRVNSKEVGEREGIKYFQYMKAGKTGFRDLDGKVVINAIYESAEMFSEDHSTVQINGKWGLINERGEYIIEPKYDYLGSLHNGLISFSADGRIGFIDLNDAVIIKPNLYWADEFSEGLCVVSTDYKTNQPRKYGYIDTA